MELSNCLSIFNSSDDLACAAIPSSLPFERARLVRAFPIEEDEHLWMVLRYVERNVRANLVGHAEDWPWSSAAAFVGGKRASPGPTPRNADWLDWVNQPQSESELAALRKCIERGMPYGSEPWQHATAERLGLKSSLHPRGRPRLLKKK